MSPKRKPFGLIRLLLVFVLATGLLQGSSWLAAAATQTDIHGPTGSGQFGKLVTVLPNGNFVVTDPGFDSLTATDVGAVYLYNGADGTLISRLTGKQADDQVGSRGVTVLSNGNYLVRSPYWDKGLAADAGAITWGSATSGVAGPVSDANSLIGSHANDQVGDDSVTLLSNGNFVANSPDWDNGGAADAGAATWGDGATGVFGEITNTNSLVGATASDQVSQQVVALTNGNYVVISYLWDDGVNTNVGAVTWGDGAVGTTGSVSATNSLVGSVGNDYVGHGGVFPLTNGNYVVSSMNWDNGAVVDAGAVTWGNGATGVTSPVTAANSLVGNTTTDQVGYGGVTALTNGNFVVRSFNWDYGSVVDAGAITWGNGATGIAGPVTTTNSLVGGTDGDKLGQPGVTALSNGNYVVRSYFYDDGTVVDAGAVTWGNGATGIAGPVTDANSLVGNTNGDKVGLGAMTLLTNGNYVVGSFMWDNGAANEAGAVTWGDGTGGTAGVVSSANSLVGSTAEDYIGYGDVHALNNGNYVVSSPNWDNGGDVDVGAVTWGNGNTGIVGAVSTSNSLVGSSTDDGVGFGGVAALSNGNYVVSSPLWNNGSLVEVGAVTWCDGASGTTGTVSTANSLVGGTANDQVGISGVTALSNGNYVVRSYYWDRGSIVDAGAVTWGDGTTGTTGLVSDANSLVGGRVDDQVGIGGVTALDTGDYVVHSPLFDRSTSVDAGAITWGFRPGGVFGLITDNNSVRGVGANGGWDMVYEYDPANHQLVVGRPADNIVTLFRLVYGVTVVPPVNGLSGVPGATVNYTLHVTNTGDLEDSFNLGLSGNIWTMNAPASIGPLAPGEGQDVTVSVTVPASAAGGSVDHATVAFTSQGDSTKSDSAVLNTTATKVFGVSVVPPTAAQSGAPGATVDYTLHVTNTGNIAEIFTVAVSGNTWTDSAPTEVGPIAAGAGQNLTVSVTVPVSAGGSSTDTATVTVTSQADPTKSGTAVLTTTADDVYGVNVATTVDAQSGAPGATVDYTLQVTNTGNITETFTITVSENTWTTSAPVTVGPLAAGASQSVTVSVTIPGSAAGGATGTATITITSRADPTKSDTVALTTTATAPPLKKIYMPIVRK